MSRSPMPSYLLENRGAFKKNPSRKRVDVVDDREIGDAPAHLDAQHAAAWAEIVDNSIPDTLGRPDRIAVEVTARLLLKMRSGEAKAAELTLLAGQLAKFGCTPADRSRVVAIPKVKKNDFDDL